MWPVPDAEFPELGDQQHSGAPHLAAPKRVLSEHTSWRCHLGLLKSKVARSAHPTPVLRVPQLDLAGTPEQGYTSAGPALLGHLSRALGTPARG